MRPVPHIEKFSTPPAGSRIQKGFPKVDFCDQAINEVFSTIQHIEKDTLHAPTDYDLLEDIKNLVAPVGISLGSLGLSSDGYDVQLSEKFKAKVDLTMAPEETHLGFIRGALEYINIHRAQKVFRIYPEVGPNKVTCYFPEDLREVAIDAVGQFVQVHGIIHYKSIARYPHQINVKKMDILPREEDLPSIFDLKGIAPDLTGGLSSEEFVQSLKDAEQY